MKFLLLLLLFCLLLTIIPCITIPVNGMSLINIDLLINTDHDELVEIIPSDRRSDEYAKRSLVIGKYRFRLNKNLDRLRERKESMRRGFGGRFYETERKIEDLR